MSRRGWEWQSSLALKPDSEINTVFTPQFVREHIIHMPQEDYINWLQSRVNIPFRQRTILT